MFTAKKLLVFVILIGCTAGAFAGAIDPIPEEGGFSGRVNVGAGWLRVKSNTIAGSRFGDLSQDRIDSLFDEPDSESSFMP
ncbi:MAG: hypothetical protein ACYSN9_00870, partial [Planctomycetota bacterium]